MTEHPITRATEQNGAEIYFIATHESPVVNIKITFPCGNLAFSKQDHHVPHLLEHLLLSETEESGPGQELSHRLQRLGAYINATTSPDELYISLRTPLIALPQALEITLQATFAATLTEEALRREKSIVVREMYEKFDGLSSRSYANLIANIVPNHFMGANEEHLSSIDTIQLDQIIDAYQTYITPSNCKIIISGSLTKKQQKECRDVIKTFKSSSKKVPSKHWKFDLQEVAIGESHTGLYDNGFAMLSFVEKVNEHEAVEPKIAKNILDGYLFGAPSATITAELRSKGLIYSCETVLQPIGNLSVYSITVMAAPEDLPVVITIILRHIASMANRRLTAEELEDIRSFVRYTLPTYLETTEDYLEWYESNIRHDRPTRTVESDIEVAERIPASQISAATKEVFLNGDIYVVAVGDDRTAAWSPYLQELVQKLKSTNDQDILDALDNFETLAKSAEPKTSDRAELYWFIYAALCFISLSIALRVKYLPLLHHPTATVSMFDVMYDQKQWLWGSLFFLPLFIGLVVEFNLYKYVKRHHLVLACLASITSGAYIYGIINFFGDIGKQNVPFFWQDFASLIHPLVFLILTPVALYKSVRHTLERRINNGPENI